MDTRQLAAFCAVVERRSFSQAAERLGVTQPAVSLQVRSLEKRLGTQLLDRSGRRVEPTEAGWRLYRGAQRLLTLEEQLVSDVATTGDGELTGDLLLGASTGPAAIVVPILLCDFHREHLYELEGFRTLFGDALVARIRAGEAVPPADVPIPKALSLRLRDRDRIGLFESMDAAVVYVRDACVRVRLGSACHRLVMFVTLDFGSESLVADPLTDI